MRDSGHRHDAVVIGAGFAGLTAACTLARGGLDVLLLEAGERAGGYCRTLEIGNLCWNLSLYSLRGCQPGGPFARLIEDLDLADEVSFIHSSKSYLVRLDGEAMPVTCEIEAMLEAGDRFAGGGAKKLQRLLKHIRGFHPVRDYARLAGRTFAQCAEAVGVTGRLLDAVGAPLMISLGVPPSRASAYFAFMKYQLLLREGVSYPLGGPDRLVQSFLRALDRAGASARFGEKIEAVAPGGNGGWQLRTAQGRIVDGKYLVVAADASWALEQFAPFLPERLAKRTAGLTPALSAALLFLEADARILDAFALCEWPHTLVLTEVGLDRLYRQLRRGKTHQSAGFFGLTSPVTWESPSGNQNARPLTAFFPMASDESPDRDLLYRAVEKACAGARTRLGLRHLYVPADLRCLTLNRDGAFCGWEMGPERYGRVRLPQRILPGVYLAGHWVDPGPSLLNAALSGRKAALAILREAGIEA